MKINAVNPWLYLGAMLFVASINSQKALSQNVITSNANIRPVNLDPKTVFGKLANGFTYYIQKNQQPAKSIELKLVVKTGFNYEAQGELGVAHLVEHVAFRSLKRFPRGIWAYSDSIGLARGENINAYTGNFETVYYFSIPSGDSKLLSDIIKILYAQAGSALFKENEIAEERAAVIAEGVGSSSSENKIQNDKIFRQLYNNELYRMDNEKVNKNLTDVSSDVVRNFYDKWYKANNQALIVVGDVDEKEIEAQIKSVFADLKPGILGQSITSIKRNLNVKLDGRNQLIIQTDSAYQDIMVNFDMKKQQIQYLNAVTKRKSTVKDAILNDLLQSHFSQLRFHLGSSVTALEASNERDIYFELAGINSLNILFRMPELSDMENVFKGVIKNLEVIKKYGFTTSELKKSKLDFLNKMVGNQVFSSNEIAHRYIYHFSENAPVFDLITERKQMQSIAASLSLEEINAYATACINTKKNRDVVINAPSKSTSLLPDEEIIERWVEEAVAEKLVRYRNTLTTKIEHFKKTLAPKDNQSKVLKTVKLKSLNVTEVKLSNGIRIIYKKTSMIPGSSREIFINGHRKISDFANSMNYLKEKVALEIVNGSGASNLNSSELLNYTSDRGMHVVLGLNSDGERIWCTGNNSNISELAHLLLIKCLYPRNDKREFLDWKKNAATYIKKKGTNPINPTTGEEIQSLEELEKIDFNTILDDYRKHFFSFSGFTFTVVGDFDEQVVIPLINRTLGRLPAGTFTNNSESFTKSKSEYENSNSNSIRYSLSDPNSAQVYMSFTDTLMYSVKNMLKLQLLASYLNDKIYFRLRVNEKGSYHQEAGAYFQNGTENEFRFWINFMCTPKNVKRLMSASVEEYRAISEKGLDSGSFNIAKAKVEKLTLKNKDNHFWIQYLQDCLTYKRPIDEILSYSKILAEISKSELDVAAAKYMNGKNLSTTIQLPVGYKDHANFTADWTYNEYNENAWRIFSTSYDKDSLQTALLWSKKSLESLKDSTASYIGVYEACLDTYANILYKLGKKDQAIDTQKVALAKTSGLFKAERLLTLLQMVKEVPTWSVSQKKSSDSLLIVNGYREQPDDESWATVKNYLESVGSMGNVDSIILIAKEAYFKKLKNWSSYTKMLNGLLIDLKTAEPRAISHYAWETFLYSDQKKELTRALSSMKPVLRHKEDAAYYAYLDTYANLLYKLGRKQEAIVAEKKALELCPEERKEELRITLSKFQNGEIAWKEPKNLDELK